METLQRTANRGSISTGYDIENSLKLEADNSEYMKRVMTATGNRKTFTISVWLKRTELQAGAADGFGHTFFLGGNGGTGTAVHLRFKTGTPNSDALLFKINTGTDNVTNRVFRDTSAWYHIVLAVDTTQATASNRLKLYVNGVQETSFATINYPTQNSDTQNNFSQSATYGQEIGAYESAGTYYGKFCGYLAEYNHIDGQALAPTEFGEFDEDTGIWKPKAYEGTYGTNGWYLDFVDAANLGDDSSGNSNNFTLTNITSADQATDTPTNNFCTFNPLMTQNNPPTISEGAMKSTGGGGTWNQTWGNIGVKNGKWYYEFKVANSASTGYFGASTTPAEGSSTTAASVMYNTSFVVGGAARIDYYYWQNGSQVSNESTGWGTISTNDVIGIALDLDSATKTFTVYKNGTALSGTLSQPVDLPTNMQDEFIFPLYVQYENRQDEANFGGYTTSTISSAASDENGYGTFEYAPPSGYYAICSKNLSEFG
jgi:hypothetical protein